MRPDSSSLPAVSRYACSHDVRAALAAEGPVDPMPEGDTVWLAARNLHQALAEEVLISSDFRVPQLATVDLSGRIITGVVPYGKHLFFHLNNDRGIDHTSVLHTHFRMDGSWHLYGLDSRWRGGPTWQIRAILRTRRTQAVGYRLPVIELLTTDAARRLVESLGPDIIAEEFDSCDAVNRLTDQGARPIGEALLDQRIVAGLGLIYVTETLFLHGVTPWTPTSQVKDLTAVVVTARRLLRANRLHAIQTTTGDLHRDRWHYVYERSGRPCRRCGHTIRVSFQGSAPRQRFAYWCPQCQCGPSPAKLSAQQRRDLRTQGRTRYRP